jgi:hypothetical protein
VAAGGKITLGVKVGEKVEVAIIVIVGEKVALAVEVHEVVAVNCGVKV